MNVKEKQQMEELKARRLSAIKLFSERIGRHFTDSAVPNEIVSLNDEPLITPKDHEEICQRLEKRIEYSDDQYEDVKKFAQRTEEDILLLERKSLYFEHICTTYALTLQQKFIVAELFDLAKIPDEVDILYVSVVSLIIHLK